jgi:hypothetical protein
MIYLPRDRYSFGIKEKFENQSIEKWHNYYADNRREDWKPFICSKDTIDDILYENLMHINKLNIDDPNSLLFYPKGYSSEFLPHDAEPPSRVGRIGAGLSGGKGPML